jgi:hypothetical protein
VLSSAKKFYQRVKGRKKINNKKQIAYFVLVSLLKGKKARLI